MSILASAFVALLASLAVLLFNGRAYLEQQLSIKNRDNAAALALAISQQDADPDVLVVLVAAQFNSGQYQHIQVMDPRGHSLVERIAPGATPEVPRWFTRLLPIRPTPGVAQISRGWQQVGTLTLMSQSHFAYRDLWSGATTLCSVMVLAGLLGGGLGTLVLLRMRQPMQAVIAQANAISERRFSIIPEPKVPELRQLAAAMNDMVSRLHKEFEEDASRFEALRKQANFDPLTGLANRAFFMANLGKALSDDEAGGGSLAIVRIARLDHINRVFGHEATDALLLRVSQTLGAMSAECPGIFAARLKGADFALMLSAECDTRSVLEILQDKLGELCEPYTDRVASSYIGFADYQPGETPSELLARIDQAVATSESEGHDAVREAPTTPLAPTPTSTDEWRLAITHVLTHPDHIQLAHRPISLEGEPQCECHMRIRLAGQAEWLPAHRFIPQAERIGLVPSLDLAAVSLALDGIESEPKGQARWINISPRSMADSAFRDRLLEILMNRHELLQRLWLEIHEIGAIRRLDGLRELARALKPLGCRLGLSHYGHQFNRIGDLYGLGLDFLKVDAGFIRDIHTNPGNQAFLAGLRDTAHKIGMKVLAEGVETQAELDTLRGLGLDGFCGPVLEATSI
jgi:predicted signal transduction protein with EAL and GGDEF domain